MLKEIFELVKGTATEAVVQNPAIPDNQNDEVVAEATNTVASGLRNIVAGGGLQSLLGLFGSGTDKKSLLGNPIVSMMMGHFAGKLMNKFGMAPSQANQLSGTLIPDVLGNLIGKTNDPNESAFSLENLIASITGKKDAQGGGIGDLLSQITGGSTPQSGGGMLDIIKELAGGAQQQQQANGGLLDLIKGFAR
ncbi:hypothetical protein HRG84_15940 [Flavisolibacter sp. BT320]|nr:hypothetical protein [Flavisolibacter longurius]